MKSVLQYLFTLSKSVILFFIVLKLKNIQLITYVSYLALFLTPKMIFHNFVYIVILHTIFKFLHSIFKETHPQLEFCNKSGGTILHIIKFIKVSTI